jgi:uncharacterized membrane protein
MPISDEHRTFRGHPLGRFMSFSDGIVAVAITVLVLPLVSIDLPANAPSPFTVVIENSNQIMAFAVTFAIVFILWLAHHRVFENVAAVDEVMMWLNGFWLLTIAFLPWPSRMLDVSDNGTQAVWLYCLTLFLNTITLHAMYTWGRLHPYLLTHPDKWASKVSTGLVFAVGFGILTIIALFAPTLALWLTLLLVPARLIVARRSRPKSPSGG